MLEIAALFVIAALVGTVLLALAVVGGLLKLVFHIALLPVIAAVGLLKLLLLPLLALVGVLVLIAVGPVLLIALAALAVPVLLDGRRGRLTSSDGLQPTRTPGSPATKSFPKARAGVQLPGATFPASNRSTAATAVTAVKA
jgi:hypothetical protein